MGSEGGLTLGSHDFLSAHAVTAGLIWLSSQSPRFLAPTYLDLLEVHGFSDELIVLRKLLARGKLDEHLAELSSTTAAR